MATERPKRPKPARTGPKRLGGSPPDAPATNGEYTFGRAVDRTLKTAQLVVEAIDVTARDAVERGVETAYTVVDEYIRRGRAAAGRRRTSHSQHEDTMSHERRPPYGSWTGAPWMNGGAAGANNPFMAPWMQMMKMWTDSMATFMPTTAGAASAQNPFAAAMGMMMPRPSVAVRTASKNPAKVTVHLDFGAEFFMLKVDPLAIDGDTKAPDIAPPTIECAQNEVTVRVTVPDAQAAGHYHGTIRDAAGIQRGQLCVDVEAPVTAAAK